MNKKILTLTILLTFFSIFVTGLLPHSYANSTNQIQKGYYTEKTIIDGVEVILVSEQRDSQLVDKKSPLYNETIANVKEFLEKNKKSKDTTVTPYVIPTPDGGTIVARYNSNISSNVISIIKNTLYSAAAAVTTYSGFTLGLTAATKVAAIPAFTAGYIADTLQPEYVTTTLVRSYSSYYGQYAYQHYYNIYTDSARTQLKKVVIGDVLFLSASKELYD